MTAPLLEGIFPALLTALDERDEIDERAQRALIRRLLDQGVQGLFLCGTSGEFPFLTLEERERLVEIAAAECGTHATLIVHVGTLRTRDAVRLAQHAERHGAAAVCAVPPFYYAYREAAVLEHVGEIAGATALPFLYYHIPARTGVELTESLAARLLEVPRCVGLKYSAPDLAFQERLQRLGGPQLRIFCGSDEVLLASLVLGAAGAIGSTYNFLAPGFLALWRAFRAGQTGEAQRLQAALNRVIDAMGCLPAIAASKEALRVVGLDLGKPRRPQSQLTPQQQSALPGVLRQAGYPESA